MSDEQPYWCMETEPFFNTPQMRAVQLYKLRARLKQLYARAPFHRRRFDEAGLDPGNIDRRIGSFEEFSKIVPVYDKQTYREHAEACGGDLVRLMDEELPVSVDDLMLINSTTGTTGDPTPYPLSARDVYEIWAGTVVRGAWRAGLRREDRVLYCFALSMVIAGTGTLMALSRLGSTLIPVGAEAGTDRMLKMAAHFRPTAFFGTPSLASHLLEKLEAKSQQPDALGLRLLFCAGEPGAGIPEIRRRLEAAYGGRVIDFGAGFGASCLHPEYQGMHWLADDYCFYELVDPQTREPVPLEDGARGEAVFTHLEGDGWAWVRNSLGDLHEVTTSPCPCGRSGFRYKVVGRTDDMLKVKGVIVYPAAVAGLLASFVPRVTGEFRLVLTEKPPLVVPPLKIRIERGAATPVERVPELERALEEAFHSQLRIRPRILWEEPGELERSTYKGSRFERHHPS